MRVVAVSLLIFLLDVAFAKTSIVLPSPTESGMETSAVFVLPEMASNKTQRLMISVEASKADTNQLEIWFCNDIFGALLQIVETPFLSIAATRPNTALAL